MKRTTVFALVLAAFFGMALAGGQAASANDKGGFLGPGAKGGFSGPGPQAVTARQAAGMRDDSRVFLRGKIVQQLADDKYLFKDESGAIALEIDHEDWRGQSVSPEDTVEIYGKIDKDRDNVEVEVKRLIKK